MGNSSCKEIGEIRTSISDLQTTFAGKQSPGTSSGPPRIVNSGTNETLKELRAMIEKIPTTEVPLQAIEEITSQLKTLPDSTPALAAVQSKMETLQTT